MALLKPIVSSSVFPWGPSPTKLAEPAGYGYLGRFWYSNPGSPFRYYAHFHPAIDLGAAEGTPIKASETGIVSAIGYNPYSSASGIRYNVRIRTSPIVIYGGGHMLGVAKNPRTGVQWKVGDKIKRGEVIGYVGHTGYATGPHVHFFVQIGSMLYNPTLFFDGGYNANDWRIKPVY